MKSESKTILFLSAAFIIGLLLGIVPSYFSFRNALQILEEQYKERIVELENENLYYKNQESSLMQSITNIQKYIETLETKIAEYEYQKGLYELYNNSQRVPFTLNAGEKGEDNVTISFDAGYGLVMEVYVNLVSKGYESDIDLELSWRRGASIGLLVGLGNANAESATFVNGIAYCEVYDDPDEKRIAVKIGAFIKEYPWIEKSRLEFFSK